MLAGRQLDQLPDVAHAVVELGKVAIIARRRGSAGILTRQKPADAAGGADHRRGATSVALAGQVETPRVALRDAQHLGTRRAARRAMSLLTRIAV